MSPVYHARAMSYRRSPSIILPAINTAVIVSGEYFVMNVCKSLPLLLPRLVSRHDGKSRMGFPVGLAPYDSVCLGVTYCRF
jgi:hypothetical protein